MASAAGTATHARFVLFGDSITQGSFSVGGWGARLADHYARRADVLNRGYSGYNSRWALELLPHVLPAATALATPPTLVTVFFGANDSALPDQASARQHVPLDEFRSNLRTIVEAARAAGVGVGAGASAGASARGDAGSDSSTRVVLITPPPVHEGQRLAWQVNRYGDKATGVAERTNGAAGEYAAAVKEIAAELGTAVVDLHGTMMALGDDGDGNGGEEAWAPMLSDGLHLSERGNEFLFNQLRQVVDKAFPELAVAPCAATGCPHNSGSRSQVAHHGPWHDAIDAAAPSIFPQ